MDKGRRRYLHCRSVVCDSMGGGGVVVINLMNEKANNVPFQSVSFQRGHIDNIRDDEYAALRHLKSCMEFFDEGTREYEIAQKSFAWIANKISARENLDRALQIKHKRLCRLL